MAQKRRIGQSKVSRRKQERMDNKRAADRVSFSTRMMQALIIVILVATVAGLAIQIIVNK